MSSSYPNCPLSFLPTEYTEPLLDKNIVKPSPQEMDFIFDTVTGIGGMFENKFFIVFEIVFYIIQKLFLLVSSVLNKYFEFLPLAN